MSRFQKSDFNTEWTTLDDFSIPSFDNIVGTPPSYKDINSAVKYDTVGRLSQMPLSFLLRAILVKAKKKLPRPLTREQRFIFSTGPSRGSVIAGGGPEAIPSTYLSQRYIGFLISKILQGNKFARAADIGCGFGRLSLALAEFSRETYGFERESHFITMAKSYIPGVNFINAYNLYDLPVSSGSFDFAMTHLVLQHMNDDDSYATIGEMKRIVGAGRILLAERVGTPRTDAKYNENTFWIDNRLSSTYSEWMKPWRLKQITVMDRAPDFDPNRPNHTQFMLFEYP
jgi:SAM-dependent methyltransferase